MAYLDNRVYDNGLSALTSEATKLHICSAEPTSFANVASVTLGNKAAITVSAPAARTPNGRKVTVSAISNGTVTANGTATHWAVVDETNSRLLAAQTLQASQIVTAGNTFNLAALDIGIPGPA